MTTPTKPNINPTVKPNIVPATALAAKAEPKELTQAQQARKAKAASRKADFVIIAAAVKDGTAFFEGMADGLKKALTGFFATPARESRTSDFTPGKVIADKVRNLFNGLVIGASIDELELFKAVKVGRGEMRRRSRDFVKLPPADRLWVKFDGQKEAWVLAGKGANPPAGWVGFLPAEKAA